MGRARIKPREQGAASCPLCRDPLDGSERELTCPGCGTGYHLECHSELGGCSTLGCAGRVAPGRQAHLRLRPPGPDPRPEPARTVEGWTPPTPGLELLAPFPWGQLALFLAGPTVLLGSWTWVLSYLFGWSRGTPSPGFVGGVITLGTIAGLLCTVFGYGALASNRSPAARRVAAAASLLFTGALTIACVGGLGILLLNLRGAATLVPALFLAFLTVVLGWASSNALQTLVDPDASRS